MSDDGLDDRVTCGQCARTKEIVVRGAKVLLCGAWLGEPNRNGERLHPAAIRDLPLRCFFFVPQVGAPDQRRGKERWPCTEHEYREAHRRRLNVWWRWMDTVDKRNRYE